MNSLRKKSGGFTLIELLIVFVIIGVLAGLAVPQYSKIVERAKVQGVIACMGALKTGAMAYRSEKGNFDGITAEYLATYGLTWDEDAGATYGKGKGLWTLTTSETDATATLTMTNDDTGALGDITMTIASDGSVTWGGSCVYKPS